MTPPRRSFFGLLIGACLGMAGHVLAAPSESFAPLVERLAPSVVTVTAYAPTGAAPRFAPDSPLADAHKGVSGERSSTGSGFVVDPSGIIVTNNHVVDGAVRFELVFTDGTTAAASLVGRDQATDLAVLRVRAGKPLPAVPWANSDLAKIGDWTIAIGNPFGLGGSVSIGVLSGRNRDLNAGRYDEFLQTDAAINQGNSGGPLFDAAGRVLGVNTAIVSPSGGSVGVGFAVPSNMAKRVVRDLVAFGEVRRGFIGVNSASVDGAVAQRLKLGAARGARVVSVAPNSPAARAGLQADDVVLSFGGMTIGDARALTRAVADATVGRAISLTIWRGGRALSISVTPTKLVEGIAAQASAASTVALGLGLSDISPTLRQQRALPSNQTGALILSVNATGPARGVLQAGDIIVEVQGRVILGAADAKAALDAEARRRPNVIVKVIRVGKPIYRALPIRR